MRKINSMSTQKISRKDLYSFYNNVCESWKSKITELLLLQVSDNIEVEQNLIDKAYSEADNKQKKLLDKFFKVSKPNSIMDQVETFGDILIHLGKHYDEIIPWKNPKNKEQKSQNALAKIQCITKVYNEEVTLDWKNTNQYKYCIYKYFSGGGVRFLVAHYFFYYAPAGFYFVSNEKAQDALDKFKDIFEDYFGM